MSWETLAARVSTRAGSLTDLLKGVEVLLPSRVVQCTLRRTAGISFDLPSTPPPTSRHARQAPSKPFGDLGTDDALSKGGGLSTVEA